MQAPSGVLKFFREERHDWIFAPVRIDSILGKEPQEFGEEQEAKKKRVCVVGAGYVGLVTGACLAALGHEVVIVERDARRLGTLERGEVPIYEPGLDELVALQRDLSRLSFTNDYR